MDADTRRQIAAATLKGAAALVVIAGGLLGMAYLRAHVRAMPHDEVAVTPVWVGWPDWLPPAVADELAADLPIDNSTLVTDDDLTRRIGGALAADGWVHHVMRVEKFADGRVEMECAFRRPVAVAYQFPYYYLLDAESVRLPGMYDGRGTLPLIQGVRAAAPASGKAWPGDDLRAGLALASLLSRQAYGDQLTGISVHNYGGREDPRQPHLRVHTTPDGGRTAGGVILWGSAIGKEVEEATASEKLDILASNWRRTGRIDAGLEWLDVSVGPSQYRTGELAAGQRRARFE